MEKVLRIPEKTKVDSWVSKANAMEVTPYGVAIFYDKDESHYNIEGVSGQKDEVVFGEIGNIGRVIGRVTVVTTDGISSLLRLRKDFKRQDIYVTTMTHPAMISLLQEAGGIITDEGGVTSHAAIIAREMGLPCLVGTKFASKMLTTGDIVELNADEGFARRIHKSTSQPDIDVTTVQAASAQVVCPCGKIIDRYCVSLSAIEASFLDDVGGKARNLSKIPSFVSTADGIAVTGRLYAELLREYFKYSKQLTIAVDQIEIYSADLKNIRNYLRSAALPDQFIVELVDALTLISSPCCAVRSSASSEDTNDNSFAGQFISKLNVPKDIDSIVTAVRECLCSPFYEHVILYMKANKVRFENFFMGIVIQEMILSEKSGVIFTRNPTTGISESVVNANFGLGESVASGICAPDTIVIRNDGTFSYKTMSDKIVLTSDNTMDKRSERVLSDQEVKELHSCARVLEKHFGMPLDIEWAISGDKLYILQQRPITGKAAR